MSILIAFNKFFAFPKYLFSYYIYRIPANENDDWEDDTAHSGSTDQASDTDIE